MKQLAVVVFIVSYLVICPSYSKAITMPCSIVLNPIDKEWMNAKGVALVYKVELHAPSFPRTNISILGVHLPDPTSFGNYDSYEGFAFIPEEISWRFKLHPAPEQGNSTWAGKFDEITAEMGENAAVQIRLSNTKTEELGPSLLESNLKFCK